MAKKSAKKIYQRELSKALREKCKKTKQRRETSQEHKLFEEIDQSQQSFRDSEY